MTARAIPGVLFAGDRELIESWRTHGLPTNPHTGRVDVFAAHFAAELCPRLLDGLDAAWDVIDALTREGART